MKKHYYGFSFIPPTKKEFKRSIAGESFAVIITGIIPQCQKHFYEDDLRYVSDIPFLRVLKDLLRHLETLPDPLIFDKLQASTVTLSTSIKVDEKKKREVVHMVGTALCDYQSEYRFIPGATPATSQTILQIEMNFCFGKKEGYLFLNPEKS